MRNTKIICLLTTMLLLVSGCGGGGGGATAPAGDTVASYSITGKVSADALGDGFQGATVTATSSGTTAVTSTSVATDNSGNYSIVGLTNGVYTVAVNRLVYDPTVTTNLGFAQASFASPTFQVTIASAAVAEVNFTAQNLFTLSGQVLSSTGQPMPGVVLTLQTKTSFTDLSIVAGTGSQFTATTDGNGKYAIGGLTDGNYYVLAATYAGYGFSSVQTPQGGTMDNFQMQGADISMDITGTIPSGSIIAPISGTN